MVMYYLLVSLESMLLNIGPLCTGCSNACLWPAGSKHSHTVPLDLGTMIQLLYHYSVSPISNGASTYFCFSLSISFLNGSSNAYAAHLGGTWYGHSSSLSFNEVPLKHPMPMNTLPHSLCESVVVLVLSGLSTPILGPVTNSLFPD